MRKTVYSRIMVWALCFVFFAGLSPVKPVLAEESPDNVLFNVDCSNLQELRDGGWIINNPEDGLYTNDYFNSFDNSTDNPDGVEMEQAPQGQFLMYGDPDGSNSGVSAFKLHMEGDELIANKLDDQGNWYMEFDARFDDLVRVSDYPAERGFSIFVDTGEKVYRVTFTRDNKILVKNGAYGQYVEKTVDLHLGDLEFHKWAISCSGSNSISIICDGTQVAYFSNIDVSASVGSWGQPGVHIINAPLDVISGINKVYFDNVKFVANEVAEGTIAYDTVIFEDDCSSLTGAGWTVAAPQNGAYITDSEITAGNPYNVEMKPVDAGQYIIYGDKTGSDNSKYTYMSKALQIGEGAWELEFDAIVKDLVTASNYQIYRGLSIEVFANGKEYKITFNDQNKILAMTNASSGTYIQKEVDMPSDDNFHKWTIACDGISKVYVKLDGQVVADFEGVACATAVSDSIKILNAPLQWQRGFTEVYIDNIKMVRKPFGGDTNPNELINDDCTNLVDSNWSVNSAIQGAYITDYGRSSGEIPDMKTVEEGQYLVYGDGSAAGYVVMSKSVNIGDSPWALEFNARIVDLMTPSNYPLYRGMTFDIFANEKRYMITFNDKNKIVSSNQTIEVDMPSPDEFHQWGIAYDGDSKVIIALDGKKIGTFEGIGAGASGIADAVYIKNVPLTLESGTTEVYFDEIKMVKNILPEWTKYDPKMYGCTVLPSSSSELVEIVAAVTDIDPDWVDDPSVSINACIYKDDMLVAESTGNLTGEFVELSLDPNGETGKMKLVLKLMNGSTKTHEITRNIILDSSVEVLQEGQSIAADAGKVYMFSDLDEMKDTNGRDIITSGWRPSVFTYDGLDNGGVVLESLENATTVEVPVNLNGWFGVYVGYVTGTEAFKVSDGINEKSVFTEAYDADSEVTDSEYEYGKKLIFEKFTLASDFNDQKVSISPLDDTKARIAYIKFKGLTDEEIAIYTKPDEGGNGKRVTYNNDGYSDFYQGIYQDEESLKELVVDRYIGQDVGEIYWCLGTTFLLNYNSQYAGVPYSAITQEQIDSLMRDGDKEAMYSILNFVDMGKNPLEIIAERAQELGFSISATMRMNAFYDSNRYPWLNGSIYQDYTSYRVMQKDGSYRNELSYAYPQVREIIKNILKEAASVENVDGVNLDFCRYPYVFGYEAILSDGYKSEYGVDPANETTEEGMQRWNQYKADIMTGFISELRDELSGKTISVRIPDKGYFEYGLDPQTWIDEGLIDVLIPSNIGHEEFYENISEFKDMVAGSNVKLYGGINGTLAGHDLTKEEEDAIKRGQKVNTGHTKVSSQQYQLRAYNMYQEGYDGIHIFNNWKGESSLGLLGDKVKVEKWYWLAYPAEWTQNLATVNPAVSELLSDIKVDGVTVEGFESGKEDYTVVLPYRSANVPEVTAAAADPDASVEITPAVGLPGMTTIQVTDGEGVAVKLYSIAFEVEDVSIEYIGGLIDEYIASDDLRGPLVPQLINALEQAEHQFNNESIEKAVKHIEDFLKHINNEALEDNISEDAAEALIYEANTLIELWNEM